MQQCVCTVMFFISTQADKLASGFLALGLSKGDRVGIWGPNIEEWILTQFATAKAGLILVRKIKN
jgi:fatty-acyl-CoA synthase